MREAIPPLSQHAFTPTHFLLINGFLVLKFSGSINPSVENARVAVLTGSLNRLHLKSVLLLDEY
jgi:hypothetical protein